MTTIPEPKPNQTLSLPVAQIVVIGERRQLHEVKVCELMDSIRSVGLLNPIVVMRPEEVDSDSVRLVAGLHRLEAIKRLGFPTIQCTVLEFNEALEIELAEIDENIIRSNPSPAEHAILTARRSAIIKELATQKGTPSQIATASTHARRRAGEKTGHEAASVRDQAKRTGESKDKIHRAMKRSSILGDLLQNNSRGTSLDKGKELDALAKLPEGEREELVDRAASGEPVSARTPDRKPKPKVEQTEVRMAWNELEAWAYKYRDLKVLDEVDRELYAIHVALIEAIYSEEGADG